MGFFSKLIGFFTGGEGFAGANNAHLAELMISRLTLAEKTIVAEKIIDMGISASGGRMTKENFINTFNNADRLAQLNIVSFAFLHLGTPIGYTGEDWMEIGSPFTIPTNERDLRISAIGFEKRHGIVAFIGSEAINLSSWLNPT